MLHQQPLDHRVPGTFARQSLPERHAFLAMQRGQAVELLLKQLRPCFEVLVFGAQQAHACIQRQFESQAARRAHRDDQGIGNAQVADLAAFRLDEHRARGVEAAHCRP